MGATEENRCFRLRRRVYRGGEVSVWLRRRVDGGGRISIWLRRRIDGGETILFYARFSIDHGGNFGFLRAELLAFGRLFGVRARLQLSGTVFSLPVVWISSAHLHFIKKNLGGTYYAE